MSKKKNQKIAYRFLRKELKNPENVRAAFACYSDSSVAFTELMRNIFGEKKGNKIIDIIIDGPLTNAYKKVAALHTEVILNLGDIIAYDVTTINDKINNEHIKRCTRLGRLTKSDKPDTVCITSPAHPEGIYFDTEAFKNKIALTAFAKDVIIFTQYQAFIGEDTDVNILPDSKIHGMIEDIIQNPGDTSSYVDFIIEIGKLYEIDTDSKNIYIVDESEYESDSSNITLIPIHYVDK